MPNIGVLLKTEISRLCRREVRKEVAGAKKASATYRRDIAVLKRQVIALKRDLVSLDKRSSLAVGNRSSTAPDRPVRFVAKGLRSLRTRLGLSAAQLARLLGVSEQSIYNWESKKALPRKEQQAQIVAMRSIGKREAQARLDAIKPSRAKRNKKARA